MGNLRIDALLFGWLVCANVILCGLRERTVVPSVLVWMGIVPRIMSCCNLAAAVFLWWRWWEFR